jgi:photosystem II stability/assembly factor-like uncharacterized protein
MNRIVAFFTFGALLFFLCQQNTFAQWEKSQFPTITPINQFATSGNRIYAVSDAYPFGNTLYLSTDSAASWKEIDSGLVLYSQITSIAASGNTLFVGSSRSGVYLTTDNGKHWLTADNGLTDTSITSLCVSGPNILAGAGDSVYISTNNGISWGVVKNSLIGFGAGNFVTEDTNVYMTVGSTTFLSTNYGITWSILTSNLPSPIFFAAKGNNILCAGTDENEPILRSIDSGSTWIDASNGLMYSGAFTLTVSGSLAYTGTNEGVFVSKDDGASWIAINNNFTDYHVLSLITNGNYLIAGTDSGVWRCPLSYITSIIDRTPINPIGAWVANYLPEQGSVIWSILPMNDSIFVSSNAPAIFFSSDNGTDWIVRDSGFGGPVKNFVKDGNTIVVATDGGIYATTNTGNFWKSLNNGLTNTSVTSVTLCNGDLFAGTSGGGVYRSTNNGGNWQQVNNGLPDSLIHALWTDGPYILAATNSNGVYISLDNGATWRNSNSGISNMTTYTFAQNGEDLYAGTYYGVFHTTNNGFSWSCITSNFHDFWINALAISGDYLFAGVYGGGVFYTTNKGESWQAISTGLPKKFVWSLAASDQYLFVGTESGLWRRPLSELTGINENQNLENIKPNQIELQQNYPNPFTVATDFRFQIRQGGNVTLKIYNALGAEVTTLLAGHLFPSTYDVHWDAKDIPPGIYFSRLQMGTYAETKRILLVK